MEAALQVVFGFKGSHAINHHSSPYAAASAPPPRNSASPSIKSEVHCTCLNPDGFSLLSWGSIAAEADPRALRR